MRKLIFFILLIYIHLFGYGQNYYIDFSFSGIVNNLDSIVVKHFGLDTTLILNTTDTLHLYGSSGFKNNSNCMTNSLNIYPNPNRDMCYVEYEAKENKNILITISDINGKTMLNHSKLAEKGKNTFIIEGLGRGVFFIQISTATTFQIKKVVSLTNNYEINPQIRFINNFYTDSKTNSKLQKNTHSLYYENEDVLLFHAYAYPYIHIKHLVPNQSQTVNFVFSNCKDADENLYTEVAICNQVWMGENLKTTSFEDGTPIEYKPDNLSWFGTSTPGYSFSDSISLQIYGVLYNWYALDTQSNGQKNICPAGWHVPSSNEWLTLINCLGGASIAGGALKHNDSLLWESLNVGATNSSGFSALPAGIRFWEGFYLSQGVSAIWWTSTSNNTSYAWVKAVYGDYQDIFESSIEKKTGCAIRCIKNSQ